MLGLSYTYSPACGSRIAHTKFCIPIRRRFLHMLGELVNIPTETLIDMLLVILDAEGSLNSKQVAEIEQIQYELQRRATHHSGAFEDLTDRYVSQGSAAG